MLNFREFCDFVFKYFKSKGMIDRTIEAIDAAVITMYKKEGIRLDTKIRKSQNKFFIFDNADKIIDNNCQKAILLNPSNQYVLLGRDGTGLMLREDNLAYLIKDEKNKIIKTEYPFRK